MLDRLIESVFRHLVGEGIKKAEEKTSENRRKEILTSDTAEEAMEKRKEYKNHKRTLPVLMAFASLLFFIILLVIQTLPDDKTVNWDILPYALGIVFIVSLVSAIYNNAGNAESVSILTKDEFLSTHDDFILYLRPFDSDKYDYFNSYDVKLEQSDDGELISVIPTTFPNFSERILVDEINQVQGACVCAIGMTKEAEHPDGAIRIYVSDKSWQQDVNEMMEKAKAIIILVANKDSCVWEIEQANRHLQKAIFIIEDQEHYNGVREKIGHQMDLPSIPEDDNKSQRYVLYHLDGKSIVDKYDHTLEGYKLLAQTLLKVILPLDIKGFFPLIEEAFTEIYNSEDKSKSMLDKLADALKKRCPVAINDQIKIDDCDLMGGKKVFFNCTLNDDLVDFKQVKSHIFPIKNFLIEQFIKETSADFQNSITIYNFSLDIVFESQMQHDAIHMSIDSSQLKKRLDFHKISSQFVLISE